MMLKSLKCWRRMTIWWVVGWATKWVQIVEILGVEALGKLRWEEIVRNLLGRGVMTWF